MIRSKETLIKALDFLSQNTSPTACARYLGAKSVKIVWAWASQSSADEAKGIPAADSEFGVCWPDPGQPPVYFHQAILQARKIFLALASMEATALIGPDAGHRRVVIEGGKVQMRPDLKVASDAMTLCDEDWTLCYGDRKRTDIFERDADGCLVPLTVIEPLPASLRIHLLRSLIPAFNVPEKRETNVNHSGSFLVIGASKQKAPQREASPLETDLRARLALIRDGSADRVTKPDAPVEIHGRGQGDPPERTSTPSVEPQRTPEPRAPEPQPAPINYGRPKQTARLDSQDRPGARMPSGGYNVHTGKLT